MSPNRSDQEPFSTPTPSELKALESFTAEYQPLSEEGVDPLALPSSHDRRGMLRAAADPTADGPERRRRGVRARRARGRAPLPVVAQCTRRAPFRLILVDDGSAEQTSAFLRSIGARHPAVTLIHSAEPPHGYTIAANLGMRGHDGDYVVLLNSDTIVTPGWLERIVDYGEPDARIGILGPLSNAASHQSVPELREGDAWATNPLPDLVTEDGMAKLLERVAPRAPAPTPVRQRLLLRRQAGGHRGDRLLRRGALRQRLLRGERLHLPGGRARLRAGGRRRRLRPPRQVEVVHARGSQADRAKRNYEIFLEKHGASGSRRWSRAWRPTRRSKPLRDAVAEALSSATGLAGALDLASRRPARRRLHPARPRRRRLGRLALDLPGGEGDARARHPRAHLLPEQACDRAPQAPTTTPMRSSRPSATSTTSPRKTAPCRCDLRDPLQVGGAARRAAQAPRRTSCPPTTCRTTSPSSPPRTRPTSEEAIASYTAIEDCLLFAKTHWLCNVVGDRHGLHVAKVEPSIDERLFRPNDMPAARRAAAGRGDDPPAHAAPPADRDGRRARGAAASASASRSSSSPSAAAPRSW